MNNLLEGAKYRKVYPINPKRKMVRNVACFPDIGCVPATLDLAVVCIQADTVPAIYIFA
jgi:acetyltransferase